MKIPTALAILLSTALGACTTPDWSEAESPKENRVELLTFSHEVHFGGAAVAMSADESARFVAFVDRIGLGYGDNVTLASAGALDRRRAEAIGLEFRRRGFAPMLLTADGQAGRVVVSINRHVVTPPSCPDWTRRSESDFTTRTASNFGCATAVNLGLMVADPGDLVRGRAAPGRDGDNAVLGVQRYRTGKMRPLPESDISTTEK